MNLADFVKGSLIGGYQNGSFTLEQVNIYALNYQMRGIITQADFDEMQLAINPPEEQPAN